MGTLHLAELINFQLPFVVELDRGWDEGGRDLMTLGVGVKLGTVLLGQTRLNRRKLFTSDYRHSSVGRDGVGVCSAPCNRKVAGSNLPQATA